MIYNNKVIFILVLQAITLLQVLTYSLNRGWLFIGLCLLWFLIGGSQGRPNCAAILVVLP